MIYIIFILLSICIILFLLLLRKVKIDEQTNELNNKLTYENLNLININKELKKTKEYLITEITKGNNEKDKINDKIISLNEKLTNIKITNEEIAQEAYSKYVKVLENAYKEAETIHDKKITNLNIEYKNTLKDLNNIKATRAAAYEALLKEQEIKENKDNYRLIPSESDLADSRRLELIKKELNKPRIICMLIWQTYWQPLAKKQFPIILKGKTTTGIYKITNQITDECYIGQAIDVYKRWCEHCKCGLGIDTPPGNKLYKAIQEYGLENFTFELLTECSQTELNEKEKYFIELYQANVFGYNGNKGVTK